MKLPNIDLDQQNRNWLKVKEPEEKGKNKKQEVAEPEKKGKK